MAAMKVLIMDSSSAGLGLDLALRAQEHSHAVRYWLPPHISGDLPYGEGLVSRPEDWEPSMDWADLIVVIDNSCYKAKLAEYFGRGYPLFWTNEKAAELELDRSIGQAVLARYGVPVPDYHSVSGIDEAIEYVAKTGKAYAIKPCGGSADRAMTCVCDDPDDAIFTLQKWKREGKAPKELMLQEKVNGVEIGISGFFGPGGWNRWLEESWEHKRFLTGDLGENTSEMGTVIRHVQKSKLFDKVLAPLTDYLHLCKFVGDCSVNCIIEESGEIAPLEFTMRLGFPDFTIRQEVFKGDPVEWMAGLLSGKDTLQVSEKIAVGVVMAHGDFPRNKDPLGTWNGYPIHGKSVINEGHLHWQQVMSGEYPRLVDGKVKEKRGIVTAGNYPLVVTGSAKTVSVAADNAYAVVKEIYWPSNVMYRLDIGKRLEEDLPKLQKHGFALDMRYK